MKHLVSCFALAATALSALGDDNKFPRRVAGKPLENVTYLHIPKTGSTFENIVFRCACRWQTPPFIEAQTVVLFVRTHCPKSFEHFQSGHRPLPFPVKRPGQVFVTLLRKPWKRVHSGLLHNFHDCPRLQQSKGIEENDLSASVGLNESDVVAYASCVEACAVNMLTGKECGASPRSSSVGAAWTVLQTFDFVGISDYWDLTLQLFSKKFDVDVVETDRLQLRSRRYHEDWAPRFLKKRRMVDDALYDLALVEIFLPALEQSQRDELDEVRDDSIARSQDWNLGNLIAPVLHGPGFITKFNGTKAFASYGQISAADDNAADSSLSPCQAKQHSPPHHGKKHRAHKVHRPQHPCPDLSV